MRERVNDVFGSVKPERRQLAANHPAVSHEAAAGLSSVWDKTRQNIRVAATNHPAVSHEVTAGLSSVWDKTRQNLRVAAANRWKYVLFMRAKLSGTCEIALTCHVRTASDFEILRYWKHAAGCGPFEIRSFHYSGGTGCFDILPEPNIVKQTNRYDVIRYNPHKKVSAAFDTIGTLRSRAGMLRHYLTRPGWRILLTRTETGEKTDLGFIDAESETRSIRNIALEDGGYEVSVISASLFWENAMERTRRSLIVRSGEEGPAVSELPPVFGLQSSVSRGVTKIAWRTGADVYADCLFGVWLSPTPPVNTSGTPFRTVAYQTGVAGYELTLTQTQPLWCAVQAVGGTLRGEAAEILLPWSTDAVTRPFDQIATKASASSGRL